jgi:hypothetical protein
MSLSQRYDIDLMGNQQDTGIPASACAAIQRRNSPVCGVRCPGLSKNEFSAGKSFAGPRAKSPAVSRYLHHWLV